MVLGFFGIRSRAGRSNVFLPKKVVFQDKETKMYKDFVECRTCLGCLRRCVAVLIITNGVLNCLFRFGA